MISLVALALLAFSPDATPATAAAPELAQLAELAPAAAPPGGCLGRRPASPALAFDTELECELWETVVWLELDVRTATIALEACERDRETLRAPPPILAPTETRPPPSSGPPVWLCVLSVAAASAGGALLGHALAPRGTGPEWTWPAVGAAAGSGVGALACWRSS